MSNGSDYWFLAFGEEKFGEVPRAVLSPFRTLPGRVLRRCNTWSLTHPMSSRWAASVFFLTITSGLALAAWKGVPEPPAGYLIAVPPAPEAETEVILEPTLLVRQDRSFSVRVGTHVRIPLERDFVRTSVGSPEVLSVEPVHTRELLALGEEPGQTTIIVWYGENDIESIDVQVTTDLDLLERTLAVIHPSIRVEKAPDRDALVLMGRVPRAIYSRRAEDIAMSWVHAIPASRELLVGEAAERVQDAQSSAAAGSRARRAGVGSVINLIQIEGLPEFGQVFTAEEQVVDAIRTVGGKDVTVRRIQKGTVPDDAADILVLEGEVRDQVSLSRVLSLAYKIYVGNVKGPDVALTDGVTGTTRVFEGSDLAIGDDIKVIADEAGALFSTNSSGQDDTDSLLRGFGRGEGSGGTSGLSRTGLNNRVDANIARASALELAGGRILSFIEVTDIPQVRVDIRVYEVNRTKLLSYESNLGLIVSDFDQGGLNPAVGASSLQGANAASVGSSGGTDIQNVFGFLEGTLSNQLQFAGSNWAIDSLFNFLETEDVARSLANPSLSVLSGEVALFEVGGRVPIDEAFGTEVGIQGVFTSTSFIEFGVKLAVRPLVGENDVITIDFAPEIITPDALLTQLLVESTGSNPQTFAFESRLLKTSSRLADGQTLLVGGLQQTQRSDEDNRTPWLSDVPLLGLLFQGYDYSDDDLEVVVMVRPTIVRDPLPDAALWAYPENSELLNGALPTRPEPQPLEPEESGHEDAAEPSELSAGTDGGER
jgi:pilus assembly protein CpaC